MTEGNPKRTPAARLARLLAKVEKMPAAKVKRALLCFLRARGKRLNTAA